MDSPDGVDRALTSEYQTSPTAGTKEAAVVKVSQKTCAREFVPYFLLILGKKINVYVRFREGHDKGQVPNL